MPRVFVTYKGPDTPSRDGYLSAFVDQVRPVVAKALSIEGANTIAPEKVVVLTRIIGPLDRQTPEAIVEVNTEENDARERAKDKIRDEIGNELSVHLATPFTLVVTIWFRKGTKGKYQQGQRVV